MTGPSTLRTALIYDYGRRVDARGCEAQAGYLAVAVYAQSPAANAPWTGHYGGSPFRYRFTSRREALGWLVVRLAELGFEEFRAVSKDDR